jgi:hypothetical protein
MAPTNKELVKSMDEDSIKHLILNNPYLIEDDVGGRGWMKRFTYNAGKAFISLPNSEWVEFSKLDKATKLKYLKEEAEHGITPSLYKRMLSGKGKEKKRIKFAMFDSSDDEMSNIMNNMELDESPVRRTNTPVPSRKKTTSMSSLFGEPIPKPTPKPRRTTGIKRSYERMLSGKGYDQLKTIKLVAGNAGTTNSRMRDVIRANHYINYFMDTEAFPPNNNEFLNRTHQRGILQLVQRLAEQELQGDLLTQVQYNDLIRSNAPIITQQDVASFTRNRRARGRGKICADCGKLIK